MKCKKCQFRQTNDKNIPVCSKSGIELLSSLKVIKCPIKH